MCAPPTPHRPVLPKVNTNRLPWGDYFGEISGNRARTAPAVDQSHPRSKMRSEKCGDIARAARKNSAAPFVVYSVGTFAAPSCIGHVPLACVIRCRQRNTGYHPRKGRRLKFAIGILARPNGRSDFRRILATREVVRLRSAIHPVDLIPAGIANGRCGALIGIGGHLTVPPLPHHRAYGSRTRRFD